MKRNSRIRITKYYDFVNAPESLGPLFAVLNEKSDETLEDIAPGSVQADVIAPDNDPGVDERLSDLEERIVEILRDRPRTEAVLGPVLCDMLGLKRGPNSERRVRTIVAHLVERGYPLGSARTGTHRGFYWLVRPEDRKAAAAHLRRQAFTILRRADRLEKSSAAAEHRGQLRLSG